MNLASGMSTNIIRGQRVYFILFLVLCVRAKQHKSNDRIEALFEIKCRERER